MFLRTIPENIDKDILFKAKRPEEKFGIARFTLNELDHKSQIESELLGRVTKIIPEYVRKSHKSIANLRDDNYAMSEVLPKAVWLADELLHNGGWMNPMGLHWRPEYPNDSCKTGKWVIHPGGTRQWVAHAFIDHDEPLEFSTFNTLGKECEFDIVFENFDEVDMYFGEKIGSKLYFSLVAEYGTIIPHALTNTEQLEDNTEKYHKICKSRLAKYNLVFSHHMVQEKLELPYSEKKQDLVINIKDPSGVDGVRKIYKAFILAMMYDMYTDDDVEIKAKDIVVNKVSDQLTKFKQKK